MKIKIITSYKPGTWKQYSQKGIESMAEQFPKEIDLVVYAEEPKPECKHDRIQWNVLILIFHVLIEHNKISYHVI